MKMAIFLVLLWLAIMVVIIYDHIKFQKRLKNKMVVLRINNPYVRSILEANGFNLCQCAYYNTNRYLYVTTDAERICGFTEECVHLIEDAKKHHQMVIDCGIDIKLFVAAVKDLKGNEKANS